MDELFQKAREDSTERKTRPNQNQSLDDIFKPKVVEYEQVEQKRDALKTTLYEFNPASSSSKDEYLVDFDVLDHLKFQKLVYSNPN